MTGPKIELPIDELNLVLHKAILDSLTTESKETLVAGALHYLLTPKPGKDYQGRPNKSPLEEQFDRAVDRIAYAVAGEVMAETGVKDKIVAQFSALIDNMPSLFEDEKLLMSILEICMQRAKELRSKGY